MGKLLISIVVLLLLVQVAVATVQVRSLTVGSSSISTNSALTYTPIGSVTNVNASDTVSARCDSGQSSGVAVAVHYTKSAIEYTDYVCFRYASGTLEQYSVLTVQESGKIHQISSVDTDGNGRDEIVSRTGIYDLKAGTVFKTWESSSVQTALAVVDVTSDLFADVVRITSTQIIVDTSQGGDVIPVGDALSATSLTCSIDYTSNEIVAVFSGLRAVNPQWLSYTGTLKLGSATISTKTSGDKKFTFGVTQSGNYTVSGTVYDDLTDESLTKTCSVVVTNAITVEGNEDCELGVDGEFNYYDGVGSYGWSLFDVSAEPTTGDGRTLLFNIPKSKITHGYSGCDDQVFNLETSLQKSYSVGTNFHIRVYANGESYSAPIGDIWVYDDSSDNSANLFAIDGLENTKRAVKGPGNVTVLSAGQYHAIRVVFDMNPISPTYKKYTVYVDGSTTGTTVNFMNPNVRGVLSVQIESVTSKQVNVDYIRTYGSSGLKADDRPKAIRDEDAARQYLLGCTIERDFNISPVRTTANAMTETDSRMSHVISYCNELERRGVIKKNYCPIDYLQKAVKYNSNCYKEAYDYCVIRTYPESGSFSEDANAMLADQTNGLDGASACSFSLMTTIGTEKIALPFWRSIWYTIKANVIFAIVVILVIAFAIGARQNRGK